jgi:hypothetical protein
MTNQPLTVTGYLAETGGGDTHWRVLRWDSGTTEGGSSGSGLWNPEGRLVGQLSGGFAFCGSDPAVCSGSGVGSCDWYGRLAFAWDASDNSANRLSDWLDPLATGDTFIDGIDACEKANVTVSSSKGIAEAGELIQFSSSVSGGSGPFTFAWDLDGDGATDSTEATVAGSFPDAINADVTLRVTDALDCKTTARLGQVVKAPRIEVDSVAAGVEQCGDGDGVMEPGETWSFGVTLVNNGDLAATGAVAAFGISAGSDSSKRRGGPDPFGYTFADSTEAGCAFDYQDIGSTGTSLTFTASSTFDALDDGGSVVTLGGPGIDFYGQLLSQVTVSTNGYLSSSINDGGGDWSNDCPIPSTPEIGTGGRIAVLHDDLIISEAVHQYFETCPRAGEADGTGGCNIFQWNGVGSFNDGTLDTEFQALLYDGSNQLVYQYLPGNMGAGASQSVGIQNNTASSGLSYSCDQSGSVLENTAVCIFHKDAQGPAKSREGVNLANSAIEVGSLDIGQSKTVELVLRIKDSFDCGDLFGIDYLGSGHDKGFSNQPTADIVSEQVGGEAGCDSTAMCTLDPATLVEPLDGFYFNPARQGNGIDLHFFSDQMFSAWFTAEAGRVPVWYQVLTQNGQRVENGQIYADILRYAQDIPNPAPNGFVTPDSTIVGEAVFSFYAPDRAIMSWSLNGLTGGEDIQLLGFGAGTLTTDQLFSPVESGWGLGYQQQNNREFAAVYFYGTEGEPRWVLTVDPDALFNSGGADVSAFEVNCPFCVWIPPTETSAGDFSRTFNNNGSAVLNIDAMLPGPTPIDWQRQNLPVVGLNPPD